MLKNYLLIAWRHIAKNKTYAAINILGLVVGLTVYVFGSLLVDYERSHDSFYEKFDRIFIAGTLFSATADVGVGETDGIYTAYGPLIRAEVEEVEEVARTVKTNVLIVVVVFDRYQEFGFDGTGYFFHFFDYIEGDSWALDDPSGM